MMALGMDFGSPYERRQNEVYGRSGGRPVGSTGSITKAVEARSPTGSGIAPEVGQSPYAGFLKGLTQPVASPYQSQFKQRANLLRGYTQGAYATAAEGTREAMGSRGFRAGESGIADTAIGKIQKAGAEE